MSAFLIKGINALVSRWEKCVEVDENYFDRQGIHKVCQIKV